MSRFVSKSIVAILACAMLLVSGALAQEEKEPTLKVGDAAPALAVGKWLKGEPVTKFESGKVYVVECWATWCGPCRQAIPHVTKLQEQFKNDVVFIGQNVWENDQSEAEPFVKEMGDTMNYRVAMDDLGEEKNPQKGKMAQTWLAAAGQNGIPCSFVVDKQGKIAWIGHPMMLDKVLKDVVAGTFDPKKFADVQEKQSKLGEQLGAAMDKNDTDAALKILDEFESGSPEMAEKIQVTRFMVMWQGKKYDDAGKVAAKLNDTATTDAQALNMIAWTITTEGSPEKRDLDLAEKLAAHATERDAKNPAIIDTYARVMFDKGNIDKAVELQTKAVDLAEADDKAEFQKALDKYQNAKKPK